MTYIFSNDQEIHLWVINHYDQVERYLSYRELLSEEERYREEQFATDGLKKRFTISRGVLRMLLQSYLSKPNGDIEFLYGKQGKPSLADKSIDLEFNLSHSHDLIIYGFAPGFPIGVDIEYINPNILYHTLESSVLSVVERVRFYQLDQGQRIQAFYRAWTRKEALLKAYGVGLSKPLKDVEVTFTDFEKAQVISIDGDVNQATSWSLHTIEGISGYCGAVIAKTSSNTMKILYHSLDDKQLENDTNFMDYRENINI